nr:cytochrome P450 4AV17 [Meteorus pulchricornis]
MDDISSILTGLIGPFVIVCIFMTIIYIYLTATFNYWSELGVPFKKPTIIVGNFGDLLLFRKSQCEGIREMYNWFKHAPYFGVFRVRSPIFIVRDPELIKNICVKDFHHFVNRGIPTNAQEILERHLFNLKGQQWKNLRSKLTPVFSSAKLKNMFYLLSECHEVLEESIHNAALNNSAIEIRDLVGKFTVDVIGSCAFGIQINALKDENSKFHKTVKKFSRPSYKSTLWRMLRTSLPKLYNFLGIQLIDPDVTEFFKDIVSQMVEQRKHEQDNKRNDFMDLLIQLKDDGTVITDNDNDNQSNERNKRIATYIDFDESMIAAQAFAFFVAGYQPSSNTIAFCLHELASHPEIQEKTRQDIWKAIHDNGGLTYQALREMTYLEAVVLETLRKYPPAPITSRRCEYPYQIPGTEIKLPAGMRVVIPIYGIHHDPEYYPDPDKFNPDRFTEKNGMMKRPYTFLPFGEGPRNCIGIRFAMVQAKMGIISFLKRHEIIVSEKTVVPIKLSRRSIVTSSENGFWLRIKPI